MSAGRTPCTSLTHHFLPQGFEIESSRYPVVDTRIVGLAERALWVNMKIQRNFHYQHRKGMGHNRVGLCLKDPREEPRGFKAE